jgi:hypothetical protein
VRRRNASRSCILPQPLVYSSNCRNTNPGPGCNVPARSGVIACRERSQRRNRRLRRTSDPRGPSPW